MTMPELTTATAAQLVPGHARTDVSVIDRDVGARRRSEVSDNVPIGRPVQEGTCSFGESRLPRLCTAASRAWS